MPHITRTRPSLARTRTALGASVAAITIGLTACVEGPLQPHRPTRGQPLMSRSGPALPAATSAAAANAPDARVVGVYDLNGTAALGVTPVSLDEVKALARAGKAPGITLAKPTGAGCTGSDCVTPNSTPVAQFNFGSFTAGIFPLDPTLKQTQLLAQSEPIANVGYYDVFGSFRNVGAQSGAGCANATQQFDSEFQSINTHPGSNFLLVFRTVRWSGTIRWEVRGTHTFVPVPGAIGGGNNLPSQAEVCG